MLPSWGTLTAVEHLTASDASFLYMENPVVHMHVTGVMVLDPSTVEGGYTFERFRGHLLERLHLIAPFRKRLMRVPFGLDHPVWVDDPDFDLDDHLRREVLPAPGSLAQLAAFTGEFASMPLPLSRPLWSMVVVEGFADGSIAVVSKMHHVAVDGSSGTDLMAHLVDLEPNAPPTIPPAEPFDPAPVPSRPVLFLSSAISRATNPLRNVRAMRRTIGSALRLGQAAIEGSRGGPTMARPFDAPRTLFNQSLTANRAVAMAKAPLDDLRTAKASFGATVNDVFLAACTQSLRAYLLAHGEPCDRALLVSVPVSVRGEVADSRSANQVSNMFVRLPVDLADPVEQLLQVRLDTRDAKSVHGAIGADMIGDVTELTPPAIFNLASRMYSRAGLADRLPPIQNLVISNVPGPPIPLYVAGARLTGVYPFGPLIEGSGLNITVLSNMGNMDIGVIGCPDIAPDVDDIAQGIVAGIEVLRKAAAAAAPKAAATPKATAKPKAAAKSKAAKAK